MSEIDLLLCSHRGPVSYRTVRGRVVPQRGGGGLINVLRPVAVRHGATWIASALTPEDGQILEPREEDGCRLGFLALPPDVHSGHYDTVCNEHLWYVFHYLYDVSDTPVFDEAFWDAWASYRTVNEIYAEAVVSRSEPDVVLVQDYHLMTVAEAVRRRRPRFAAPLVYFHHAPWSGNSYFGLLPDAVTQQLLSGMLAHDVVGFHASRWAEAFLRCCDRLLGGAHVASDEVRWNGRTTKVIVAPGARDHAEVLQEGSSEKTEEHFDELEKRREGRRTLVRVERIDLSKNVLRGLLSFERLLERRPGLARDVWFLALGYASRPKVARYRRYYHACVDVAERINARFSSGREEGPLRFDVQDDFHRSLAGLRIADTTLVNPVFDGLNLVAKEAAVLNERDGALVLSRNAGVFEEIGEAAIGVNPFDVRETSEAIERALEMPAGERRERAEKLRQMAMTGTPEGWLRGQLLAAGLSGP